MIPELLVREVDSLGSDKGDACTTVETASFLIGLSGSEGRRLSIPTRHQALLASFHPAFDATNPVIWLIRIAVLPCQT
jgi:hypothetical protein